MRGWHLAQVNIGRLQEPLDHPQLAGFVDALDPVNAAADAAPGLSGGCRPIWGTPLR